MRAPTLVATLVLAGVACAPDRPLARGDIVLVTVDTLRADHLGLYGYERDTSPHIDRWFADAAVFERAYATEASTPPSMVSLLTGRLPQEHRVRLFYQLADPDLELVPELLPREYQRAAFVSNIVLTHEALGIGNRFDHYDDYVDEDYEQHGTVYERNARRTTDAALRWLVEERDPDRPLFLWVHYIDPHGPYAPPADATVFFENEGHVPVQLDRIHVPQRMAGVDDALDYVDLYDAEIAYVDAQIGRLLAGWADGGRAEDALVVLTADHGETMAEHERWFAHVYQVYEGIVRVPLLVRGPGVPGGRHRAPVSGIDVAPTLLAFAGAPVPGALRGRSLLAGDGDPERVIFSEAVWQKRRVRAAIRGDEKWVVYLAPGRPEPLFSHTYDLAADPGERRRQPWRPDPAADALTRLWRTDPDPAGFPESAREGTRITAPKVDPRAGERELEALRALGYVEDADAAPPADVSGSD